jgi:hypothetical protein
MTYLKLTVILCAALVLQSCSMEAGAPGGTFLEPQSGLLRQVPAQVARRLQLDIAICRPPCVRMRRL